MSEQEQMISMELPTLEQLEAVEAEALIDLEPEEARKEPVKYFVVSNISFRWVDVRVCDFSWHSFPPVSCK